MKVSPRLYRPVRAVMERLPTRLRGALAREAWIWYRRAHNYTHRLDYLFWETTLRCNLQCIHCGSSCTPSAAADELTTAEIDDALASIARKADPRGIMLVASGGEPLVREDLLEVMGRAAGRGFRWGMVSNGLLVDHEMVENLERAGMRTVTISLDGTEERHDWVRDRKGSLRKAVRALELLNESSRFSIVEALTTLNRETADDLPFLLDLIKAKGIKYWRIGTVAPIGRSKNMPDLWVTGQQLRNAAEFIARHRGRHGALEISFTCEGYLGESFEPHVRKNRFACWAGIRVGGIMADGAIGACPAIPRPHLLQGNIRNLDFMTVWERGFKQFRDRRWMKAGGCTGCEHWRICHGGGIHFFDPGLQRLNWCHHRLIEGLDEPTATS
jgi:radical SAM protein with 4Fe4S-binding SPASM domain